MTDAEKMAMRDGFAMAALVGLLCGGGKQTFYFEKGVGLDGFELSYANACYTIAEAMMEVRANRPLP
jgi:hypothetical protein